MERMSGWASKDGGSACRDAIVILTKALDFT